MTQEEFMKRNNEIRMKYDILALADLMNLYEEYGKDEYSVDTVYNELHDEIFYTPKEIEHMKKEALKKASEMKK